MSVYKYKTAIVTGGASGIGAQTARIMCLQGMNVVIADLESSRGEAEELISSLSDSRRAIFQPVDVCSWPDLRSVFDSTIEKFGSLEIVVANAGIMETREFFDFDDIDPEGHLKEPSEAHRVIDVNLKGVMNTLKLAFYYMRSNGQCYQDDSRGSVVIIASPSSYFGGTGVVSYVTSKHGAIGLLRSCQRVAGLIGVRVNAVAPAFTPTSMTSSLAANWAKNGLPQNSTQDVAEAILDTALNVEFRGRCIMILGSVRQEVEGPRAESVPVWMGSDVMNFIIQGDDLFRGLGGYPLPKSHD